MPQEKLSGMLALLTPMFCSVYCVTQHGDQCIACASHALPVTMPIVMYRKYMLGTKALTNVPADMRAAPIIITALVPKFMISALARGPAI